jgi:hypothetical protein
LRKFPKTFHPRSSAANERKKAQHVRASSSIQTVTVGTGFTPVQRFRGRGLGPGAITAGGDLHPALKMNDSVVIPFLQEKKNKKKLLSLSGPLSAGCRARQRGQKEKLTLLYTA